MTIPWWTILTAIISASAALIGVFISNKAQEKRLELQFANERKIKRQELKTKKLEELFILFQKWEMDITTLSLRFIPVYKGELVAGEAHKQNSLNSLQERGDYQKFQAILNLHFKELKAPFENVIEKRGELLSFLEGKIKHCPENLPAFIKAQKEFEAHTAQFRDSLSSVQDEL